ncbi:MAG: cytochrome c [Saprospiraceae bacterium]|nr:cytochrome c [Saprospiraceae bacterium]
MKQLCIFLAIPVMLIGFSFEQFSDLDKSALRGKVIYTDFCVTCHLANGKGTEKIFPPLAKSDYLKNQQTESIKSVKYGQKGKIIVNGIAYNGTMPSAGLEDDEIADVINYINHSWGNNYGKMVTKEQVQSIKK